jgi:hypothetical protein
VQDADRVCCERIEGDFYPVSAGRHGEGDSVKMSLAFNVTEVRPTPVTRNGNADGMRAVPQFEPRTIVGNAVSPWERLATQIGGNGYCNAAAAPGDPLFYAPATLAQIGGDYGVIGYEGAPVADTMHRMVRAKGTPAFLRGTMSAFLMPQGMGRALGDDGDDLPDDFFSGLSASPSLPTDSSGLSAGFFSGASASPLAPSSSVYYTNPAAPVLTNDLTFAPPTITVPTISSAPGNASTPASVQTAQAQAITSLAQAGNTAIKAATTNTALTAQQAAALAAAQNPLAQVVPGLNMTVGNLLLMGGVLVAGAVLISKLK